MLERINVPQENVDALCPNHFAYKRQTRQNMKKYLVVVLLAVTSPLLFFAVNAQNSTGKPPREKLTTKSYFTPAPPEEKIHPVFRREAEEALLTQTLLEIKTEQKAALPIHTERYWRKLPAGQKRADDEKATRFGQSLYLGIISSADDTQQLPINNFAQRVQDLAALRDWMWKGGKLGNIIIADLINRTIYQEVLMRTVNADEQEIAKLSDLSDAYTFLWANWEFVGESFADELGFKLNKAAVNAVKPISSNVFSDPDWQFDKKDALGIRYSALQKQLVSHLGGTEFEKFVEDATTGDITPEKKKLSPLSYYAPEGAFAGITAPYLRRDRDERPFLWKNWLKLMLVLSQEKGISSYQSREKFFKSGKEAQLTIENIIPSLTNKSAPIGPLRWMSSADFIELWSDLNRQLRFLSSELTSSNTPEPELEFFVFP